jgi:hypothetical protein
MTQVRALRLRRQLCRWPLLEHLGDGFLQQLLILVAVFVQGILSDPTPDHTLILRVLQINDQRSDNTLFWSDAAHAAADPTHAPRTIGSLLFHPAVGGQDHVGILVLPYLLPTLALQNRVDILLRYLRQY